jgi:4-amino-4-deoxy-L-arabinose transferase-like glycosyltransferase
MHKPFWSDGGRFERYKPEFVIAIFNQILLLVAVWLTFLVAKTILDTQAAWLAAVLMLCSDELWKFSVSGLPTLLLLVIFLGLIWCLASFEALGRAQNPEPRRRLMLAVTAGLLAGLGMLTRYSFGCVMAPVFVFLVLFGGQRRSQLAGAALVIFAAVVSPWIIRNLMVSGTPFGTAGYALLDGTFVFPGSRLMQMVAPDMSSAHWVKPYLVKLAVNARRLLQDDVPRLGGGWTGILFLAGLLLGLRNVVARRLRYFTMMCLGVFLVMTALGQTGLSDYSPDLNSENLLVLLTPLAVIFGVAFFLTLLGQMNLPAVQLRYAVIVLVVLLVRLQFILTLLPPKTSPVAYPPYYPPEIQEISGWMRPDELMMSDVPWAVAWYGDRQCTWTTINCQYEFYQLNDYVKPIQGLYLTLDTLNAKMYSECLHGGVDSWGNFALRFAATKQVPPQFPLVVAPSGLLSGLFLTDRQRWQTE